MSENKKAGGDEPSQPKKSRRRVMTPKRKKLVEGLTKFDSVSKAGRAAGYQSRQASHAAMNAIRKGAPEYLAGIGVSPRKVLLKLASLMEAKEERVNILDGIEMSRYEVRDNGIQFKASVYMAKLLGLETPTQIDMNINHVHQMEFMNAREEDLDKFLQFCATFGSGLPSGTGSKVQAEPIDVAAR